MSADNSDPIFAAITAALVADAAHCAVLDTLNEDDEAVCGRANAAADRATLTWYAAACVTPTTMAGLCALLRFYAERFSRDEPCSSSGEHFEQLAALLGRCDPGIVLSTLERSAA